uniref:F-type H+-transporting ATPase subunit J n=1 Tax=Kwoniella bestiolae CBS 10118 TaxID=1296100 RepID=A0A1B9GA93_9TREE|nr:F-type H+-transporting ATPase subunit J [Kwoniella bestiolae CBS 10118]OCF27939.1 F-type H+-transporting ATPase subunit J [Kwoniella bestiolae CBS 10118]
MFGLRAWPTPIVKPLWPFMIAGVVTVGGIWKLQDIAVSSPDALKDPKNPFAASKAKAAAH